MPNVDEEDSSLISRGVIVGSHEVKRIKIKSKVLKETHEFEKSLG